MLEAAKARTKMTKMMLKVDTLKGLLDRKVGTNGIEKAAKLVTDDPVRNETVVIQLMRIALDGAGKKLTKQKKHCSRYFIKQPLHQCLLHHIKDI